MNTTLLRLSLVTLAALLTVARVRAQATNDWFSLDAAGGTSASANYLVGSTVGQPDAGLSLSASYSFVGGFWALGSTTPSAPPPVLGIRLITPGRVFIWWPSPSTGFVLQENNDISNASGWTDVPSEPGDDGMFRSLTVPPNPSPRFFRLRHP